MPNWLTILFACLGGVSSGMAVFGVWLKPLFKMREDVNNNKASIEDIKRKQANDYAARKRSESFQRVQIKALLVLLNSETGAVNENALKTVKQELEECLIENV